MIASVKTKTVAKIKVNTSTKVNLVNKLGIKEAKNFKKLLKKSNLVKGVFCTTIEIDKKVIKKIERMCLHEFKLLREVGKYKRRCLVGLKDYEILLAKMTVNEFVFLRNILRYFGTETEIKFV